MLRGIRLVTLTAVLIPALLLTACADDPPVASPAPTVVETTQSPAFATKEQAYAAAEKVYKRYLRISTAAGKDPDKYSPSMLDGVTSSNIIVGVTETVGQAEKEGIRLSGRVVLSKFRGQRFDLSTGLVNAYVCVDYSHSTVVDGNGKDVTPATRASTRTSIARFGPDGDRLLFTGQSSYQGQALC